MSHSLLHSEGLRAAICGQLLTPLQAVRGAGMLLDLKATRLDPF